MASDWLAPGNQLAGIAGRVSEDGTAMVLGTGEDLRLVDRDGFRALVQQGDLSKSRLTSHVVRPVQVAEIWDLAFVRTRTDEGLKDGQTRTTEALQVLRRYESGWRILLHVPDLVGFTVEITEVLPESQAERVGLGNFLIPNPGATTSGPDVEAIVRLFDEIAAGVRERGFSVQRDFYYEGAVLIRDGPQQTTSVLSLDEGLSMDASNVDRASWRSSDVRAVVNGRVALAEATTAMRLNTGEEVGGPYLYTLLKEDGRWRIFALIPPFFTIHPDVPAHLAE